MRVRKKGYRRAKHHVRRGGNGIEMEIGRKGDERKKR